MFHMSHPKKYTLNSYKKRFIIVSDNTFYKNFIFLSFVKGYIFIIITENFTRKVELFR